MNKSIALGAVFAVAISMGVTPAFAQYMGSGGTGNQDGGCLLYTSPSPRD